MTIGFQPSKDGLNQLLGTIATTAGHLQDQANVLITWAAQHDDAYLTLAVASGGQVGWTAGEAADFRTYVADLTNWIAVSNGKQAQAQPNDFLFHIRLARIYV